jgi:signal transduction histidine kinase/ActR/RegA family two-component response regulator/HAMP domain-containing protein
MASRGIMPIKAKIILLFLFVVGVGVLATVYQNQIFLAGINTGISEVMGEMQKDANVNSKKAVNSYKQELLSSKKEYLKSQIQTANGILERFWSQVYNVEVLQDKYGVRLKDSVKMVFNLLTTISQNSNLSEKQKKNQAKELIASLRYGADNKNYFWVHNIDNQLLIHPHQVKNPYLRKGQYEGSEHFKVISNMTKACLQSGDAYLQHTWNEYDNSLNSKKFSYVRLFKPWGWVVGAGIYLKTAEMEIKKEAIKTLKDLRYGKDGKDYFWIHDLDSKMIMHPYKVEYDDQDMSDFKDPRGKRLFAEMTRVCKLGDEGFVDYYWPKYGMNEPQPKLSFVKLFKPWGWIVGTGFYIDDVDSMVKKQSTEIKRNFSRLSDVASSNLSEKVVALYSNYEKNFYWWIGWGLVFFVAVFLVVISRITNPLNTVVGIMEAIASGDLTQRASVKGSLEIRNLCLAMNSMVDVLQKHANVADSIAEGNLDIEVKPKSDLDVLGFAHKRMVHQLKLRSEMAHSIANGNFEHNVDIFSDMDEFGKALQKMVDNLNQRVFLTEQIANGHFDFELSDVAEHDRLGNSLKKMAHNLKIRMELRQAREELMNMMRGELELKELGSSIIGFLCGFLNSPVGVVYICAEDKIEYLCGFAHVPDASYPPLVAFGEGLIGQAALDGDIKVQSDLKNNSMKIKSASFEQDANFVLVVPVLCNEQVQAVFEFGCNDKPQDYHVDFLSVVSESIAIALSVARSRLIMEELLNKTLEQAEDLKKHQKMLERSNKNLATQTSQLSESEEQLKLQQIELKQKNELIQEKAETLEHKKEELEKKNKELEEAQELLSKKAQELELSSRYKSEFLANMSHELRTPLNSLLILSQLLMSKEVNNLTSEQQEYVEVINKSGNDLLHLINEILDLAKIEAGKMSVNWFDVAFKDVETALLDSFERLAHEKGLWLKVELDSELPDTICTDHQKLLQILKNLVSNAIKFTQQGGVTIRIKSTDLDTPGVCFEVADTGIGILNEVKESIFEAFYQVDGSDTRQYGGTGLGLSICIKLAKLISAKITVKSEIDQGSCFRLFVPLGAEHTQDAEFAKTLIEFNTRSAEVVKGSMESISKLKNLSVLLVDDDERNRYAVSRFLVQFDVKLYEASNGKEAIDFINQTTDVGLVLMDIMMPVMDGYEAIKRIRQEDRFKSLPIIALTAKASSADRHLCLNSGATDYVSKPVDLDDLLNVILEHI